MVKIWIIYYSTCVASAALGVLRAFQLLGGVGPLAGRTRCRHCLATLCTTRI
jgi:hypothetical protein